VEQSVLGHVREDDVPGFEIPARYFHFVRSGDPRPLAGVLEHNRQDLLSLALLTARAAVLLEQGASATVTAREAFGLGCLYRRGGMRDEALACFARAVEIGEDDPATAAEALRECAVLSRRARRYDEAAAAWRRLLELGARRPRLLQEASEALAVHHEHRDANLALARDLARQSLQLATTASRAHAVRHRLTRLNRKMGNRSSGQEAVQPAASLF
jgi:tetratricopeptide (TPR) repeat protein